MTDDGRRLPPAPMPPELAALVDETKRDQPGPPDTPDELLRRLATLTETRARHAPLANPERTRR